MDVFRYFASAGLAGSEGVDPFILARDSFTRLTKSPPRRCAHYPLIVRLDLHLTAGTLGA